MMRNLAIGLTFALLVGCNRPQNIEAQKPEMYDVSEVAQEAPANAPKVAVPRIAYSYTVTYAFDRRNGAEVQERQLALCRQLGLARCVVVKSSINTPGPDEHVVNDEAIILVDAKLANEFNRRLDAIATGAGATTANRQVEAEDVTRQVIDTDARVRAKQTLAERLLAIIRSGKGKVGELVEAERAYAATQEELDAARGEQAELAQRIAMSRVTINYAFDDTPGGRSPIRASLASAGGTLETSLAALLTAVVAAMPWLVMGTLAVWLLRWVRRKRGWRWPRRAR